MEPPIDWNSIPLAGKVRPMKTIPRRYGEISLPSEPDVGGRRQSLRSQHSAREDELIREWSVNVARCFGMPISDLFDRPRRVIATDEVCRPIDNSNVLFYSNVLSFNSNVLSFNSNVLSFNSNVDRSTIVMFHLIVIFFHLIVMFFHLIVMFFHLSFRGFKNETTKELFLKRLRKIEKCESSAPSKSNRSECTSLRLKLELFYSVSPSSVLALKCVGNYSKHLKQ